MKKCFKCNVTKDRTEFYGHPQMGDGLLGKCKECTKADVRINYAKARVERSEYERRRFQDPIRRAKMAEYTKSHRSRHPERYTARKKVGNAIRDGRMARPSCCGACGLEGRVQAHHDDYSKPFEVRWMCFKCHREVGHGQVVVSDKR